MTHCVQVNKLYAGYFIHSMYVFIYCLWLKSEWPATVLNVSLCVLHYLEQLLLFNCFSAHLLQANYFRPEVATLGGLVESLSPIGLTPDRARWENPE